MIALTGGDTSQNYIVTRDGDPVGELDMKDLVKALAPETGTTGTNTPASP
jgi:glycine betaine/proline transport system ATP-binding protein